MTKSSRPINNENKTISSYVIGFVLSLFFTIVPYLLVVNHRFIGTKLLVIILSFAMIQLVVQVTFFLHLGRGPKPRWNLYFFLATFSLILVVVGGSVIIINNLHRNLAASDQTRRIIDSEGIYQVGGEATGACQTVRANHVITLRNGKTDPIMTVATRCDTLTFRDENNSDAEITFGTRDHNIVYAGIKSIAVQKSHTKTITLSELGAYQFHDQQRSEINGSFAVLEAN
ncbi:MAG: cytochrome o ubiquinol oxidase subunit IV [Candidatus Saccharimonadales bacterium]